MIPFEFNAYFLLSARLIAIAERRTDCAQIELQFGEQFLSGNHHIVGRLDTDSDAVRCDFKNCNFDVIADHNRFVAFASEYEHVNTYLESEAARVLTTAPVAPFRS